MPTSSVGRTSNSRRGVTLVEMMIVVMLLSLMTAITFPSVSSGIDSLRMGSACDDIASVLNAALNRAERRQHPVEIVVSPGERSITAVSFDSGYRRRIEMPGNLRISQVLPPAPGDPSAPRHFLLFPGGAPPRLAVVLDNSRGDRRMVRIDPVSGVAFVEKQGPE